MSAQFQSEIASALGASIDPKISIGATGSGDYASCFDAGGLALASVSAAAQALACFCEVDQVHIDQRLALKWFEMTLRPIKWTLPGAWDPIAGDYETSNGWVRLHTNAPHHREAALAVLGCSPDRDTVALAVSGWEKQALEDAIAAAGGCCAAMHGLQEWAQHPQGRAVAREPLIAWNRRDQMRAPVRNLRDIKVLDLTRVLAGPVATRFLAGFGAQVLRIDPPNWNEPGVEPEVTLGKRCAGLDLHSAEDRQVFQSLLAEADVLVHGYRPGALAVLGYDGDDLQRLSPGLIDVSLCAYGWTGPLAGRRGFDSLVQMSSGIAAAGMERAEADRPVPLPVQALDHATGYMMAAGVLTALSQRNAGEGTLSARLSLARTAALLTSSLRTGFSQDTLGNETGADLDSHIESTEWGPANRVRFPVTLGVGAGPVWQYPAGPLRRHSPAWQTG